MNRQTVAVTLVILLGVQLGLVAYFAGWLESKPSPTAQDDNGTEKVLSEPARRKAIPAFFEQLADAHRDLGMVNLRTFRDDERWVEETVEAVRRAKGSVPPDLRTRLTETVAGRYSALTPEPLLPPWKSTRLDKVVPLKDANEVEVFASHRLDDGSDYHMRWWLKYSSKGWRYFDWEDRELDERFSVETPEMPKMSPQDIEQWGRAAFTLRAGEEYAKRGNIDGAADTLGRIALAKFPAILDAHRSLLSGIVALRQGKPDKALKHFDKAESIRKPIPYIDRLRARAYLALGEGGRALDSLNRYTQRLGDDPQTFWDRGTALATLGLLPSALECFRKALEKAP